MAKKKTAKIFVLDTNVLLHDYQSIYAFEENDIVIPITVLEELDKFKKGQDQINFHARELVRTLDLLAGDDIFSNGIKLGPNLGKLFVETGKQHNDKVHAAFMEQIPDHRILAVAANTAADNPNRKVVLVTKDINLRMKAKSLGVFCEDYQNDKVRNIDTLSQGVAVVNGVEEALISKLYENGHEGIPIKSFNLPFTPLSNEYFILKNGKNSIITYYNPLNQTLQRVYKRKVYGIEPRNAEQTFAFHALSNPEVSLIALTGKAGTGKTLLALAAALEQHENYTQIMLARPIVALANKDLGYLPGTEKEKIKPYMQPLFDNLTVIKQAFKHQGPEVAKIDQLQKEGRFEISPLAYIRGRSLAHVFFIVDEAQNLTPHEVKTIITRAGEGSKIVFTGDVQQIDSPYLDTMSNGLSHLSLKFKGQELFSHINLVKGERSRLAELASNLL
ncbi:MAG: PhoH family protein [Bacteroidales bacterium]